MALKSYRLYVWEEDFLTDWTSGLAVAAARTKEEAIVLILAEMTPGNWRYEKALGDLEANEPRIVEIPGAAYTDGGA